MSGVLRRLIVSIIVVSVFSACGDNAISDAGASTAISNIEAPALDKTKLTEQVTAATLTPVARIVPRRKVTARPTVTIVPKPVQLPEERRVVLSPTASPSPSLQATSAPVTVSPERNVPTASTSPLADLTIQIPVTPSSTASAEPRAVVGRITTTRGVDRLQRPEQEVTGFVIGERVYISVEFRDVRDGAVLGFRWRSPGGCNGEYETDPQSAIRRGFFAFYVNNATCQGVYDVDITVDRNVQGETTFTVNHAG